MKNIVFLFKRKIIFFVLIFIFIISMFFLLLRKNTDSNLEYFELLEQNIVIQPINIERIQEIMKIMKNRNVNDKYSVIASLIVSNIFQENGYLELAKDELLWLSDSNKHKFFQSIAKLRLSSLFINSCQYDKALECLCNPPISFRSLYDDRKGDIFFLQGDQHKARELWKLALCNINKKDPLFKILELKIDACK